MIKVNRQILLAKRPESVPDESTFKMVEAQIPVPDENQVLVRTHYLSVDPYMRGRMKNIKSYAKPFQIGEPLTGDSIGEVILSKNPDFSVGEMVIGTFDWADYSLRDGSELRKINLDEAPITTHLHVTGMTGLTAYFGLLDIGKPRPGETVVVSGAAGAVGMVVGQIAKIKGCRVVGIAGSDEKLKYLKEELGFDDVLNYKKVHDIYQELERICPKGIDVYYDNVGGEITDATISLLNFYGRVPLCGQISMLNSENIENGPRLFTHIIRRSILLKGFIYSDYKDRFEEGRKALAQWIKEGKIKYKENIVEGLENAPDAFLGLFRGDNLGKQLVKIGE
ncbi:NADP-dependent oxidoreductase [Alkalihalobacillus sp. BA299]|uniref:NADP-dependent oxidoreductase n=1 Tax=Alkalihalobacillus sp. BA299 TaxID=2815938 RepID=UPI001ADCB4DC|nr:NADP-dependent oxidoreductase [Alkalihalobacillus sp. BA299]